MERLFKALADATRLRILGSLLTGEVCVCHIHESLKTPQPKASRHLAYLRRAGRRDPPRRLVECTTGWRRPPIPWSAAISRRGAPRADTYGRSCARMLTASQKTDWLLPARPTAGAVRAAALAVAVSRLRLSRRT